MTLGQHFNDAAFRRYLEVDYDYTENRVGALTAHVTNSVGHALTSSSLNGDQADAVRDGLSTRVQGLKGPPRTGKTVTTAASILSRIAARLGQDGVVLVSAHTNPAVDTLIQRLLRYRESFRAEAATQGLAIIPSRSSPRIVSSGRC